ncbi:hypothetical protein RSOLAG1IB_05222 [Rhizoctonia solani AG-1 IB]|uniref:Cyclin N-terminal domain-containing protein n=1 Tax=Thanatephorus cucumeris (strain AG1-IB / isolate 7/3/14) TaxID=1108050 RepID=M5CAM8_THACB|nr:hypothetical protein BN14_11199 [Rhizoctonia solani AG-1 IB]CEL63181.1 hypothetical protein RSOLAG1IB_05222 [Rhizoctonia solani AG-1 IB]
MFTSTNKPTNSSTLTSTYSTIHSDISFAMSGPSVHSVPTTTRSSQLGPLRGPRRAYKQVMAKLRTGLSSLKLKTKKAKKTVTGGQLASAAADAPAGKFGRPIRAVTLPDAYYGWEHAAKTSAQYIMKLFDCPSSLPGTCPDDEYPELAEFIAYALFICQFELHVNDYALCLLWRLKEKHPEFEPPYGHGIYLAALSLAAKMTGHEDFSPECWAMAGQWIFSNAKLELSEHCLGGMLLWKLDIGEEQMESIMEHIRVGDEPAIDPIPLPPDYDDDDSSILSVDTSSSLSTCSILSTWSLVSMREWDESTRGDSAIMTAPDEKVDTNPYGDAKIWTSLPASNVPTQSVPWS